MSGCESRVPTRIRGFQPSWKRADDFADRARARKGHGDIVLGLSGRITGINGLYGLSQNGPNIKSWVAVMMRVTGNVAC